MLSERMKKMKPSATVELTARVEELRRQGVEIISFNVGEPDFDTPKNIRNAAKQAIDEGFTRYTAVPGIFQFRNAICKKFKNDNNVDYTEDQIVVSTGAKQALTNALLALVSEGDEVIIPTPCWVSYIDMVTLAGGKSVLLETKESEGFQLNIEALKKAITDKTKAIIINTPNNPTGVTYDYSRLKALGELAIEKDFYIISDEVYEKLVYDRAEHICIASISDAIKERTVVVNGLSKAYAMTGWRLGFSAASKEITRAMNTIQGHVTSAANSITQKAAVEALTGDQGSVEYMRVSFDERRKYIVEKLNSMKDISCMNSTGAFYVMPNVSKFYGKKYNGTEIKDSFDLCNYLLEEANIAIVPGAAFEAPDNVRISYSNSIENIIEGMDRMEKALMKLE